MPKLKPETQSARRERILDAAEHCFAQAGFHRTTMQDICKAAGISPGALYVYFDSKEALIAGLSERDRVEFAERFSSVATAEDFLSSLTALAEHYFGPERTGKARIGVEIGLEGTRNPQIAEIFCRFDREIQERFAHLFQRLKDEGRIAPTFDTASLAKALSIISDGVFWRRAVDPDFDTAQLMPTAMTMIHLLLNPVDVKTPEPSVTTRETTTALEGESA